MSGTAKEEPLRLVELLNNIARQPTSQDLWMLRGALLECAGEQPAAELAHEIARGFFLYVSALQSKMSARAYNVLASRLDISAVGVLALQDILIEQENLVKNLVLGGIGEGLMIAASRQYVKAWEQELFSLQRESAWTLYAVLWQLSCRHQSQMSPQERRVLIETTLAPVIDDSTVFEAKILLVLRLYQIALLLATAPFCPQQVP